MLCYKVAVLETDLHFQGPSPQGSFALWSETQVEVAPLQEAAVCPTRAPPPSWTERVRKARRGACLRLHCTDELQTPGSPAWFGMSNSGAALPPAWAQRSWQVGLPSQALRAVLQAAASQGTCASGGAGGSLPPPP